MLTVHQSHLVQAGEAEEEEEERWERVQIGGRVNGPRDGGLDEDEDRQGTQAAEEPQKQGHRHWGGTIKGGEKEKYESTRDTRTASST